MQIGAGACVPLYAWQPGPRSGSRPMFWLGRVGGWSDGPGVGRWSGRPGGEMMGGGPGGGVGGWNGPGGWGRAGWGGWRGWGDTNVHTARKGVCMAEYRTRSENG